MTYRRDMSSGFLFWRATSKEVLKQTERVVVVVIYNISKSFVAAII